MNILIVEDEPLVGSFIDRILREIPTVHVVDTAINFDDALSKVFSDVFDMVLVDIFLGKNSLNGIELCRTIRKSYPTLPIIMVTSHNTIKYLEEAFEAGANDYIAKPFRPRELVLRVERWFSLCQEFKMEEPYRYKELSYNPGKNEFFFSNRKLRLSKKNKALLLLFLKNPERILPPSYIQEKFWGDYFDSEKKRNLRSNIQLLRESLTNVCDSWIQTIRGEGYVLQKE